MADLATLMGGSESTACRLVQEGMAGLTDRPAKELLAAELSLLNVLKEAVVEKTMDLRQVDTSKLLGLEAPTKIAETNPDGSPLNPATPEQKREQIIAMMEKLGEDTEAKYGRDRSPLPAAPAGHDGVAPERPRP
jgi:hypothetical protein